MSISRELKCGLSLLKATRVDRCQAALPTISIAKSIHKVKEPLLTRHDLEARIVKLCSENDAFREGCVDNPAAAFSKFLDVPRSSMPKIVLRQETPGSWHLVVPMKAPGINELSEEDLEKVAGGTVPILVAVGSVLASASVGGSVLYANGSVAGW